MKKLFYLIGGCFAGALMFFSCSEDTGNPGNFDTKSELEMISIKSLSFNTEAQPFVVKDKRDTIYHYQRNVYDTVFDADGQVAVRPDGTEDITTRVVYEPGIGKNNKGTIIELEPVVIDWTTEMKDAGQTLNTLEIDLVSNARWSLGTIVSNRNNAATFYSIVNGTNAGGGSGYINLEFKYYSANQMSICQPVFTQDSSIVYMINFDIHGARFPR